MIEHCKQCWERFFFAPADPRIYAFIRISVSVILCVYLLVLAPDWIRWFGEEGVMRPVTGAENIDSDTWSLFNWIPATKGVLWFCWTVFFINTLLLCLGCASRVQIVCIFLWVVSMHHRNNLIWEGGDVLLRILLFLMLVMPLGKAWSLDLRWKPSRSPVPIWPLRLLQIQLSFLYLSSVGQKIKSDDWLSGQALHFAFQLEDFSLSLIPIPYDINWPLAVLRLITWGVIAIEALLIWGVWLPSTRRATVTIGIVFHLMLELTMNLFVFQWLMILILLTHVLWRGSTDRSEPISAR